MRIPNTEKDECLQQSLSDFTHSLHPQSSWKYSECVFCLLGGGVEERGTRCPSECACTYDKLLEQLAINCSSRGLLKIPKLPITIKTLSTHLLFGSNGLTQLPNTSLEGYDNLKRLNLANNKLTNIQINQLPKNLKWLDIRNNNISSLDSNVAKYLMERQNEFTLAHDGMFWKCNCNNTNLLSYLDYLGTARIQWPLATDANHFIKIDVPIHFYHLKGPCPSNCICCVSGADEDQFIINCTSKALKIFPVLPNNILGDSSLLLDNNLIETLSTTSMRNSTLKEMHLKNNNLSHLHLDQIPSNLRVLDIRQNNFTGLDDDVTQLLSNITKVQLSENPWQCSCKYVKFLAYMKKDFLPEYQAALRRCSGQEYCPHQCICCKDDENHKFIINCSNLELMKIPSKLPIVENATLLFEHNNLQSLDGSTKIKSFDQLKELHLRYNSIKRIENLPTNIQLLDIRNNSLSTLNNSLREFLTQKSNMSSLTIFISGNNWTCLCKEIDFFRFAKNLAENIKDLCKTECHDSRLFVSLEEKDLCPEKIPRYVIYFTSFIILSCLLSFLQCFWKSIVMWLYEKRLFLKLTTRLEKGTETKYDCFLAYCHKDSHFVGEYVERLEHGRNRLRLCFYERDWLAGEPIPDCICHSVENSKCIVILMTKNFLKSVWGRLEFRLALHATSKDQYKRLIVIIYPGVENFDQLDGELQSYLKLNTYLMQNDVNFWNKLIYALPHKMLDECEEMEMINIET
ncbi:protein toll-like [Drosophila tropicalis]|uniref:protein toll-like n=1 Tax=Drosophila tropicalis TaxID=46794 RepID=UPI0035AC1EC4